MVARVPNSRKKSAYPHQTSAYVESGGDLLSRAVTSQVPSACGGLTSVFGMGTGGTLQPLSPEILFFSRLLASAPLSASFALALFAYLLRFRSLSHLENHTGKVTSKLPYLSLLPPLSLRLPLFASLSLRSSPRPISIGKLPHCCAFTADLFPLRL